MFTEKLVYFKFYKGIFENYNSKNCNNVIVFINCKLRGQKLNSMQKFVNRLFVSANPDCQPNGFQKL